MKKKILIVDDEPDVRKSTKILLEKAGYKVLTAVDGDDCLKKLKKVNVDLVLLDIMMPGKKPKEIIKNIKKPKVAYLTVVRTSEVEKGELLKKNVVDFIEKPFEIKDLLKRIKKILGSE